MNQNQSVIQLLNTISKKISNTKKIKKKQKILISISGGQDSICLFFIFLHLKKQWKWSFGIVYCNHLWQNNSFYSGSLILKIAYLFKIPMYYTISSDKIFKEKNSRYWRYDFFFRLSFFYEYEFICTGHTLNDTLETNLFQNIRASSQKNFFLQSLKYFYSNNKFTKNKQIKTINFYSLYLLNKRKKNVLLHQLCLTNKCFFKNYLNNQNMFFLLKKKSKKCPRKYNNLEKSCYIQKKTILFKNSIDKLFSYPLLFIFRPILVLNRFDLNKLVLFFNLPLYPDITNQTKRYSRNRIRKDLLPTLKFFFNPQIEKNFFQFEKIKMAETFQLNLLSNRFIKEFYFYNRKNIKINTLFFLNLPVFIQRKLINQFLKNILSKKIQFINIQNIINLIKKTKKYNYSVSNSIFFTNNLKNNIEYNLDFFPIKKTKCFLQVGEKNRKFFPKQNFKLCYAKQKLQTTKFFDYSAAKFLIYSAKNSLMRYKTQKFIEYETKCQVNLFSLWFLNMFKNFYFLSNISQKYCFYELFYNFTKKICFKKSLKNTKKPFKITNKLNTKIKKNLCKQNSYPFTQNRFFFTKLQTKTPGKFIVKKKKAVICF